MANPRAVFDQEGIGFNAATFLYDSSIVYDATQPGEAVAVGLAVKLNANGSVGLTTDGSNVHGKLVKVDKDGFCSVQIDGRTRLPGGTAATLTVGSKFVGALNGGNPGYIRVVNTAAAAELGVARGAILNSTDPTQTWVNFD